MSSNGPYKSRLFNFINRQAIEFNSRLGKTFRNLKVTVTWGVQILLYPFYLLVQTGRWAERQIGQKIEEIKYKLPIFNHKSSSQQSQNLTDEVISNVLEEVQISLLSNDSSELTAENILDEKIEIIEHKSLVKLEQDNHIPVIKEISQIRGIASLLSTKSLVLVTNTNEIINILNPEQQKKLEQLIIWAIAEYWIFYRNQIKKIRSSLPLITSNNSHIIIPIRLFWQVMGWLQIGAVARGVNLFGESSLTVNSNYEDKKNLLSLPTINSLINKVNNKSENSTKTSNNQSELLTYNNFFPNNNQLFNISNNGNLTTQEDDPFKIEVLIWAAVDYFFGNKNKNNKNQLSQVNSEFIETDPWLVWEDLSTKKTETDSLEIKKEKQLNLLQGQTYPQPNKISQNIINRNLINYQRKEIVKPNSTYEKSLKNNRVKKNNKKIKELSLVKSNLKSQTGEIFNQEQNNNTNQNIEAKPDWLETEATPIGYVKNPLEIILQWLDKIILFIEEISIKIIEFIKRVFVKNK